MSGVNTTLSKAEADGLVLALDRTEVLAATVAQLRKDLDLGEADLPLPAVSNAAFESLRAHVLHALERWQRIGSTGLSRAINRVDLTERMVDAAMSRGGFSELAGMMVLRCLQKVLLRKHFAQKG
ncbi:MAG: hypothetical protein IPP83_13895 [Flavobacteriales bacterium]|nr:hypothetical protein [Flavobacteriales bacterium]